MAIRSEIARRLARWGEPVDAASLVAFRFTLGVLLVIAAIRQWAKGAIADQFAVPTRFFAYDGLSFVRPLPGDGMYFVRALLAMAGVALAIGLRPRVAGAVAWVMCGRSSLVWRMGLQAGWIGRWRGPFWRGVAGWAWRAPLWMP